MSIKTLKDLLRTPLFTTSVKTSLADATAMMATHHLSSLLVTENGAPLGIVTERDILNALAHHVSPEQSVARVMSAPILSAPETTEFREGYHQLALHNIRHLLVTDAQGAPVGVVSESDFRSQMSSAFISRLRDVRGVMSANTLALPQETSALTALKLMANHHFSCVVATEGGKPCGILTEYDAVKLYRELHTDNNSTLRDVMKSPVRTLPENSPIPDALKLLKKHGIRHLVVIDGNEHVVGLVTEHDIVHQIEIEFAGQIQHKLQLATSEIKQYQSKLRAIFDTANIFLVLLDTHGNVTEINAAALAVSGMTRNDVIGAPVWNSIWRSSDPVQQHHLQQVLTEAAKGVRGQLDTRHLDAQDNTRYCDCRFQPIFDTDRREVEYILVEAQDITDLKSSQQQLKHLAFYDPLTNLPNRTQLSERMTDALQQARRSGMLLSIAYLDLDHFKPVNDTLGHEIGDQLLVDVANRLQNAARQHDTVARLGGDEFVLLLPDLRSEHQAREVISRILQKVAAPYTIQGHSITISASIGVTLFPDDDCDPDMLLRHADQAMYRAKQEGRNRYFLFDSEASNALDNRQLWVQQAHQGLAQGEFELLYQPKVDMKRGAVIGAEALIRWHHPVKGTLLPAQFLTELQGDPVATLIDDWVLEEGINQLSRWQGDASEPTQPIALSLNISGQQLVDPGFVTKLEKLLARHPDVPKGHIELEILENTALDNIGDAGSIIRQCKALGVGFALDDFGTGYSSLTHLKRLPADTIKIDCSFVRDITEDPEDLAIIEGILGLATAFRLTAVAEGVETIDQGTMLLHLGCNIAQGFGIAPPMPASEFPAWVKSYRPVVEWQTATAIKMPAKNFPLLAASVDHRGWVSRIIAYVNSESSEVMPNDAISHQHCRFGRWLNSDGVERFGSTPLWAEVDQLHKAIHRQADLMVDLADQQQGEKAKTLIPSLLEKRDNLLNILSLWFADSTQRV